MAQMLFYEHVVPVSLERHKDLSIERVDFNFAGSVNSVPLTAVEIPHAASEYTIVFAGNDQAITPIVVLGLEDSENRYVADDGSWPGRYIPAFVRRYPFVFSRSEDGTTFTLCVDESWAGCNREGRGERLFDDNGERTPYLNNMMEFLKDYQTQFARTQVYCNKLKELDLLEPMKVEFTLANGDKKALAGFMAASREKLNALPPEKLSELAKTSELELTYNHLSSIRNFALVPSRGEGQGVAEKQEEAPTPKRRAKQAGKKK